MRAALVLISVLVLSGVDACAAATTAEWAERPFFPRRFPQKVPPPQFYATTRAMPAGAEVRIKVVKAPKDARLLLHDFLGGPVFSRGVVKEFSDLAADQVLTYKLAREMKVGVTSKSGDEPGTCAGLERKDGRDVMKYSFDDRGDLVIEVKVVGK